MSVLRKRGPCSAAISSTTTRGTSRHCPIFTRTNLLAGSDYPDSRISRHWIFNTLTLSQYCFMHVSATLQWEDMFSELVYNYEGDSSIWRCTTQPTKRNGGKKMANTKHTIYTQILCRSKFGWAMVPLNCPKHINHKLDTLLYPNPHTKIRFFLLLASVQHGPRPNVNFPATRTVEDSQTNSRDQHGRDSKTTE